MAKSLQEQHPDAGFNGAALRGGAESSMLATRPPRTITLQRGRAPGGRGMGRGWRLVGDFIAASTGPRSGGARNRLRHPRRIAQRLGFNGAALRGGAELLRDRCRRCATARFNGAALRGGAECRPRTWRGFPHRCFNGAALRGGAECRPDRTTPVGGTGFNGAALRGGAECRAQGQVHKQVLGLQRGRAPGGRGISRTFGWLGNAARLQRGRAPGGRGIYWTGAARLITDDASTGPRSGGARNDKRRNRIETMRIRFNGAALRGGAECRRRRPNHLLLTPLQRGRAPGGRGIARHQRA